MADFWLGNEPAVAVALDATWRIASALLRFVWGSIPEAPASAFCAAATVDLILLALALAQWPHHPCNLQRRRNTPEV